MDVLLSDLLCICSNFVLELCFALRIMSTVKNTKNITNFLHFFLLLDCFYFFCTYLCCIPLFDRYLLLDILFFVVFLWLMNVFLSDLLIFVVFLCLINDFLSDLLFCVVFLWSVNVFLSDLLIFIVFLCLIDGLL